MRVDKVDPQTGKISLGVSRPAGEPLDRRPRENIRRNTVVRGTVTKLMDFGAFVELEPGVEGLVHISELSHKRVWRASDVVHEGDAGGGARAFGRRRRPTDQPVDEGPGRSGGTRQKEDEPAEAAASANASRKSRKPQGPLSGGLGRSSGERFGLKW